MDRVEVDIGVGLQCGPWSCLNCGWAEDSEPGRFPIPEDLFNE